MLKRWIALLLGRWKRPAFVVSAVLLVLTPIMVAFLLRHHAGVREERNDDTPFHLQVPVPASGAPLSLALYQSLGVKLEPGNRVTWANNGKAFDVMADDIRQARRSMNLLFYIWEKGAASDRLVAALVERAHAGVACRILVDDFGSPDFGRDVRPSLSAAGCEVRVFRPLPGSSKTARNHRKVMVIDGRVALTGGLGVRDNWLGDGVSSESWRDSSARFAGPAVLGAQQVFAENWQEAGGELLPAQDFPDPEAAGQARGAVIGSTASSILTRTERLTQLMIAAARSRIWISNAYFVPSRAILEMLAQKAAQGVDVRVLAPGKKSDSKTAFGAQHGHYGALIRQGVQVFQYEPSMMHSKTMLVDDQLVSVGSTNFDPLSLHRLEEITLLVEDRDFAAELARDFLADCQHAQQLRR
jgi:cardiolipin synthase A/B